MMPININTYNNVTNTQRPSFKSRVYKSLAEVKENTISAFQPLFIEKPKFPNDVFFKYFADTEPKKRNYLHKFANLNEHYNLLYNIFDLKLLKELSVEKLKSLFLIASEKDSTGFIRFIPKNLLQLAQLPQEKINFIKPFARQKNFNGRFNYKINEIYEIAEFSQQQMANAMQLFEFNLPAKDLITLSKDKNADIKTLVKRLKTLQKIFSTDICELGVKKYNEDYIVFLTTQQEFKTFSYVFDNKFNLVPEYKSNVDFDAEKLKETNIFKRLNPFKSKQTPISTQPEKILNVSDKEHFLILDKIQEHANYLKSLQSKAYQHNFYVLQTGDGHYIEPDLRLPENMLSNYYKQGAISNEDLIKICTENAGLISDSDLKYFSLNKIRITPYDTEKYLDIRKTNALSNNVEIGSEYYNKVLKEVLQNEKEKLQNITAGKKLIIIDGLPGSGKSTIINSILKKDKNSYYTPDSDDIKTAFKEVYKNGEGANLVHKASSAILKKEILPMVFEQGKNLIYQTTGGSVNINNIIQQAKKHGYDVDFIHITTPKNLSVERSISRFEKTGRFIDPYVTLMIVNYNNQEKEFAAKIFSHNKNVQNAYIYENGKMQLIKEGQKTGKAFNL